jgi:hypothetical protein
MGQVVINLPQSLRDPFVSFPYPGSEILADASTDHDG